jgi:hypothetical protein
MFPKAVTQTQTTACLMRSSGVIPNAFVLFALVLCGGTELPAQSTAFTYGGRLSDGTNAANGTYDFKFTLFSTNADGVAVAGPVTNASVVVNDGLFNATVDFGAGVFTGPDRWLEIGVRGENSSAAHTVLSPRQRVTATPYAITAGNLGGLGARDFAQIGEANHFTGGQIFSGSAVFGQAVSFEAGIRAPLRIQGDAGPFAEIRVANSGVALSADDSSGDHHGTALLIESGSGTGPDKNGGNIVLLPGFGTGQGKPGRVAVDGDLKVTGLIAATTLFGDGGGLMNLSASALNGAVPPSALAGTYGNPLNLINPANTIQGTFTGDGNGLTGVNAESLGGFGPTDFALLGQSNYFARGQTFSAPALFLDAVKVEGRLEVDETLTAATLSGDGSGLRNVAASNLVGVLGNAQLAGVYSNAVQFRHPANQFQGVFTGDGGGLINLSAATLSGVVPQSALAGTYGNPLSLINPANVIQGTFAGNGNGLTGVNAERVGGLRATDFALLGQSNYFTRGQAFSGPVLFQDTVKVEGRLEVGGNMTAATLSGDGSGLRNVAASNLVGVLANAQMAGVYSNAVQFRHPSNQFQGVFTGDGSGLINLRAAALTGTMPQSALAGTYDNPLNLINPANTIRGAFAGDASGLASLNAAALATGTVPDARLSANVAFLNGSPTFSGSVMAAGDLVGTRLNVGAGHTLTGQFATIAGGQSNSAAGQYSFVAGRRAKANHDGAFVWADSTDLDFSSGAANQFLIRANGGVAINTNNPAGRALSVNGLVGISGNNSLEFGAGVAGKHPNAGKIGYQTFTPGALDIVGAGTNATSRRIKFWAEGGATFNGTGTNPLVVIANTVDEPASLSFTAPFSTWRVGQNKPPDAPGAFDSFFIYQQSAGATRLLITDTGRVGIGTNNPVYPLHLASGAFCSIGGQWTSVSDRNTKEDFRSIKPREVLAKVAALPITKWKYKTEAAGVQHLGPTAQDFHAAFVLGESEKAIGTLDANGVALAAIQGLNEVVREKDAEIRALKAKNQQVEDRLKALEARMDRICSAENRDHE